MQTFTIELPEALSQEIEHTGVSRKLLETAIIRFVELYLQERRLENAAPSKLAEVDGAQFARRVISQNRELFEELAKL